MSGPTKHVLSAEMPVPATYYQAQGNPVFSDNVQGDLSAWHAGSGVTISRAFNDLARRQEMRVTASVVGSGSQGQFSIGVPTAAGAAYRFTLRCWSPTPGMKVTVPLLPYTPTFPQSRPNGQQFPVGLQPVDLDLTLVPGAGGTFTFTAQLDVVGEIYVQALAMFPANPSTSLVFRPLLAPTDATLTLDESWSPYCQASLTCAIPDGDVLAWIDPRKNLRIKVKATRTGAESMVIGDLDTLLTQGTPTRYNLAARPRSNVWTGPGTWQRSDLSGPTITPPNGVAGGSRFMAASTPAAGAAFVLDTPTSLLAGSGAQVSLYARCGPAYGTATLSVTIGSTTITSAPQELLGSHWCRLRLDLPPLVAAASTARVTLTLDGTARAAGTVLDLTQVMITQVRPADSLGTNRDGVNPSFEKALSGHASGGSAVNTQDASWSEQGAYSLKCVAGTSASSFYPYGSATSGHMKADLGLVVGRTYTVSATARLAAAHTTAGASASARKIVLNTATGGVLSGTILAASPAAPNVAGVYRLKATFTMPAGVDDIILRLYNGSATAGDTIWWDALMVEDGVTAGVWSEGWIGGTAPGAAPGEYFDGSIGRVGDPVGFPVWTGPAFDSITEKVSQGLVKVADFTALFGGARARTNLVLNPSFEVDVAGGWSATNGALSRATASGAWVGTGYALLAVSAAGSYLRSNVVTAPAGTPYAASAYVRGTVGLTVRMRVTYWTGSGTGTATTVTGPPITLSGTWQRVSMTGVVPAGNATLTAGPSISLGASGNSLHVDGVLVETGTDQVGTYFDGDSPDVGGWSYDWASTANASTSRAIPVSPVAYLSDLFGDQYGYVLDPDAHQVREFDLLLRGRSLDYQGGIMRLDLCSDEMLMQDYGRTDSSSASDPPNTFSLRVLCAWAVGLVGGTLDSTGPGAGVDPTEAVWDVGQSLWDFIDPFVSGAGLRLYCDEARVWRLTLALDGSAGTVSVGGLTVLDDQLDRESWADAVVIAHEWTDATGNDITKYAASNLVSPPTKTLLVTKRSKSAPKVSGANALAAKTRTRGRVVGGGAVSDYSITPGQSATFVSVVTLIDPLLVSAVSWSFPDATMRISTRDLPL